MPPANRRRKERTFLTMLVTAGAVGAPGVWLLPLQREFGWSTAAISSALAMRLLHVSDARVGFIADSHPLLLLIAAFGFVLFVFRRLGRLRLCGWRFHAGNQRMHAGGLRMHRRVRRRMRHVRLSALRRRSGCPSNRAARTDDSRCVERGGPRRGRNRGVTAIGSRG